MTGRAVYKLLSVPIAVYLLVSGCMLNQSSVKINNNDNLKIYFFDVGQGESTLLILPNATVIMVDTGSPAAGPMLVDNIRSLGIDRIDHLIFTHQHDDHTGGVFNILHSIKVRNLYDNGFNNYESDLFDDYVQLVRKDRSTYHILHAGNVLNFGEVTINVLNPELPPTGLINEDSIVLRVSYRKINILLTGDIRNIGEKRIMESGADLKSNVLKVGHHGDRSAGTEEFLKKVSPEVAIVSVGTDNKYSKPHEEALSRLTAAGAAVLRTDLDGQIAVETDGFTYSVMTGKDLVHQTPPVTGER